MVPSLDHLAVAALSLEGGELEQHLGVSLSPGGQHARMGTYNRLLRLGKESYLELIAVDPAAVPDRPRWFELDDPTMKARLTRGPRLVHWVARVETTELPVLPFDIGPWERFERGDLSWQLTVRPDGTLPADGVVPSLIYWDGRSHPAARLPALGVSLESLELAHPRAAEVQQQLDALGLSVRCAPSSVPRILARIRTPSGLVTLDSTGPVR